MADTNINPAEVDITDEDIKEEDYTEDQLADGSEVDWKAEALKLKGINKRRASKLKKLKESKPPANPNPAPVVDDKSKNDKSGELDLGSKAYLISNGIKDADETAFVQKVMKETGKTLEQVLESKYFQAELKEMRDKKSTEDATPPGTRRSNSAARDSVEYWLNREDLPPADQVDLRRKVVNARIKARTSGNQFTDNPVAGSIK